MTNGTEKIQIIIIDDIGETRENLRKLLSFEPDFEVLGAAAGGEEGIELAQEVEPDVVLMDVNMPEMDGIVATQKLLQKVPTAQIVMLSVQGETDYLRRAMLAGARDYLTKPASGDELVNTIRRVYETAKTQAIARGAGAPQGARQGRRDDESAEREGDLVVVFAPKGGTGGTTIAVNTAIALQQEVGDDRAVALMDGNLQFGDVGVMLNLRPHRSIADLTKRIGDLDEDLLSSVMTAHGSGLSVLLAPPRPEAAETLLAADNGDKGPRALEAILTTLREGFDVIVADTWSWIDDIALTLLDAATLIVLVVTPDIPAIKSARLFLELAGKLDYEQERILLVVNGADRKGGIRIAQIEKALIPVTAEIPYDERAALPAANRGAPMVMEDPEKPIARHLIELAKIVEARLWPSEESEKETGRQEDARNAGGAGLLRLREALSRG